MCYVSFVTYDTVFCIYSHQTCLLGKYLNYGTPIIFRNMTVALTGEFVQ